MRDSKILQLSEADLANVVDTAARVMSSSCSVAIYRAPSLSARTLETLSALSSIEEPLRLPVILQLETPIDAEIIVHATEAGASDVLEAGAPASLVNARAAVFARVHCEKQKLLEKVAVSARQMERFGSTASHDMKEPLRMIILHLSLLNREMKGRLSPAAQDSVAFAISNSKRLAGLIDSLIGFARCEAALLEVALTDCQALFNEVVSEFEEPIKSRRIKVSSDALPTIKGDRKMLFQVFQNLVSNAIKFNKSDSPSIHLTVRREADQCIFEIEDNGVGIPEGFLTRVFEPFVRGHGHADFEGAGIGLSVCRAIVEKHGGQMSVHSEPGKGSRFRFSLPC